MQSQIRGEIRGGIYSQYHVPTTYSMVKINWGIAKAGISLWSKSIGELQKQAFLYGQNQLGNFKSRHINEQIVIDGLQITLV